MINQFLILKDRQRPITDYTQRLEEHEFAEVLKQLGAEDYHRLSIATTIKRIAYTARLSQKAQSHLILMGCELISYSKLFNSEDMVPSSMRIEL